MSEEGYRWSELATYNAEVGRGLLHDAATVERMAAEQAAFDREQVERMTAEGWIQDPDHPSVWTSPARKRWWQRGDAAGAPTPAGSGQADSDSDSEAV